MLQKSVTEWKPKHQHPQGKERASGKTLQPDSLYKAQTVYSCPVFLLPPMVQVNLLLGKHLLARHTRICLAGAPQWNRESWHKHDSWTLKVALCFFLLDFSNTLHLWSCVSGWVVYQIFYLSHTACVNLQSKCEMKSSTNTVAAINQNLVKCFHLKKSVTNDALCLQFSFWLSSISYKPENSLTPVHGKWKAPGILVFFFFSLQFKFLLIPL